METTEIENNKKAAFCQTRRRLLFKEKNTETRRKNSLALSGLPSCLPLRPTYLLSFRCFKKISIEQAFPKIQKNFLKLLILSA
jgi:hypothetical protein